MRSNDTPTPPNPSGLCMCGCGEITNLARQTDTAKGNVGGKHLRYIAGHHARKPRELGYDPLYDADLGCWIIPLPHGERALVDTNDLPAVRKYIWSKAATGYAQCNVGRANIVTMHRVILSPPNGMEVDHINGDRLDNRRGNLRVCSSSENSMNRSGWRDARSVYKGVTFDKVNRKWRAKIRIDKKTVHLGRYVSEMEAALAYDAAAAKAFGEFARLNFPET